MFFCVIELIIAVFHLVRHFVRRVKWVQMSSFSLFNLSSRIALEYIKKQKHRHSAAVLGVKKAWLSLKLQRCSQAFSCC